MPSLLFFLTATTLDQNFIISCLGPCKQPHKSSVSLTPCFQWVPHLANQSIFLESILDHVTYLLKISQQLPPTYRIKTECLVGHIGLSQPVQLQLPPLWPTWALYPAVLNYRSVFLHGSFCLARLPLTCLPEKHLLVLWISAQKLLPWGLSCPLAAFWIP